MRYTNNQNLHPLIVKAATRNTYVSKGDISVTTLIDSPKIAFLKKRYQHHLVMDVEDSLNALEGTMKHSLLELADISNTDALKAMEFAEVMKRYEHKYLKNAKGDKEIVRRKYAKKLASMAEFAEDFMQQHFKDFREKVMLEEVMTYKFNGWILKGQFDRFEVENKALIDLKVTTVWTYKNKTEHKTYSWQQNIYALMIKKIYNLDVDKASLLFWFRDFQKIKRGQGLYPPAKVWEYPVKLLPLDEVEDYVIERIKLHQKVETEGEDSYECTPEERWAEPDMWKVYKKGGQRAKMTLYSEAEAERWKAENTDGKDEIRFFKGRSKRCEEYCLVSQWCNQFKKMQKGLE